jgi:5-enolpyruvylshikimate-3-phosphate synthase
VLGTDGLPGGALSISLEESSQYLSGLLLAAPLAKALPAGRDREQGRVLLMLP